jgi:hypothetical protein
MPGSRARRATGRSSQPPASIQQTALLIDDSERAIEWAAAGGLRGVLVRRRSGEDFESSVPRAFDEVEQLL